MVLITIPLAHGRGPKTLAALLGTAASLLLTALLALIFTQVDAPHRALQRGGRLPRLAGEHLAEGLLLAGMVIGALGVLDDVTVSQASTVLALRRRTRRWRFAQLFRRRACASVATTSARPSTRSCSPTSAPSLPVLLLFSSSDLSFGHALTTETVATQVVGTLVGSIGLIAASRSRPRSRPPLALDEDPEALATSDDGHAH